MNRNRTKHEGRAERRARQQRESLSRSVQRAHENPGNAPSVVADGHVRIAARGVALDGLAFRHADYGQLCQRLGLRPSQPSRAAAGRRPKRGRR